jgi:hypothetical protein
MSSFSYRDEDDVETDTYEAFERVAVYQDGKGGGIDNYYYDWGDGGTAWSVFDIRYHSYTTTGTYATKLQIENVNDFRSILHDRNNALPTEVITITSALPVAVLKANPTRAETNEAVNFSGIDSYSPATDDWITNFEFSFDGAAYEDKGETPTATYSTASTGTYVARLKITDDEGATASDEVTITVYEATYVDLDNFRWIEEMSYSKERSFSIQQKAGEDGFSSVETGAGGLVVSISGWASNATNVDLIKNTVDNYYKVRLTIDGTSRKGVLQSYDFGRSGGLSPHPRKFSAKLVFPDD